MCFMRVEWSTIRMSHDEERARGVPCQDQRERAPRHWLHPLVGLSLTSISRIILSNSGMSALLAVTRITEGCCSSTRVNHRQSLIELLLIDDRNCSHKCASSVLCMSL